MSTSARRCVERKLRAAIRTNVYVDGFNLYYGCLKGTAYRWLDISRLCALLLPMNTINRIRYFTAPVQSRPGDPDQPTRQEMYLRALATIPILSIHKGQFLTHDVPATLVTPLPNGTRTVRVWKTEEKGSDVNIAACLLMDGFQHDYEVAVLISNDSDLATPLRMVRDTLHLPTGILNPYPSPTSKLRQSVAFYKQIRTGALQASQFPVTLHDSRGTIRKPATW